LVLAKESRLPRWIYIPDFYSKEDVGVAFSFYTFKKVKVIVYGPPENSKKIYTIMGEFQWHPFTERQFEKNDGTKYPQYFIITVNNIDEIFEQRNEGDIIYVGAPENP
jgi:hypothetical protein